jgi:hypothetical protein
MSESDNSRHRAAKMKKRIEEIHHTLGGKADALSSRPCSETSAEVFSGITKGVDDVRMRLV